MAFIIIAVILQIIARELIYFPVSWTQDAAKYGFIWMSLIGAAVGIRKAAHVSINIFSSKLSKKIQVYLDYLINVVITILMIFLLIQSIKFSLQMVGQSSPTLGIPMSYIYLSLIIFSLLGIV